MTKNNTKDNNEIVNDFHLTDFFENVVEIIEQARKFVGRTADLTMTVSYFEIGRMIVEKEQDGKNRAEYGKKLIRGLSEFLTNKFKKGFSLSTLKNAKQFYIMFAPKIQQTMFGELPETSNETKSQTMFGQLPITVKNAADCFKVSWSHYLILMRIENEKERQFYEIETAKQNWTVRQLQRQYNSSLYERLALSRDKDEVIRLSKEGLSVEKPQDILKNPLVLEFLGLEESHKYSESDLETEIFNKLSSFLYELGTGFLFEARQKRFTFNEQNFFVDLVFYNRLLQCYVLIDLKTDILKHQDLGQMQMYVNYFDRYVKQDFEKPTIGILLCKQKEDSIVELTLPQNSNIYASEYRLYLPNKDVLQNKLAEWVQEFEEEHGIKKL